MTEIDKRLLNFIETLKQTKKIRFDMDFCRAIGMQKQRLYTIKNYNGRFTIDEIKTICKVYHLDANAVLGLVPSSSLKFQNSNISINKKLVSNQN
ncbi:Uncharacterised protein [Candidatus Ornithobacterium hominis]|uniref:hypothetical protein n=1 Tax=Candidatus Ornithobacterium hominis TaxID=2497989 RepID=UPI000E5BC732|nr:hypothetical protein [Candidatus Ornithobacterium hominis]SZD72040.1 Uncharacterised protein [Candidatus Ornithobacterium hominis]